MDSERLEKYFPQQAGIAVAIDWDMITAETVEREYPDLILLEQENMRAFSDPRRNWRGRSP